MRKTIDRECGRCGKLMVGVSGQRRYCPECVKIIHREAARENKRRKAAAKREMREAGVVATATTKISPKPAIKSIEQVVREANAAKMSYGQYVAKMRR